MRRNSWTGKRKSAREASADANNAEAPDKPLPVINVERARTRTLQRAAKLLAARPRSVAELRERLLEKNWTNGEIVDGVIAKLGEYNYLNDEEFAANYAAFQVRQKAVGRVRVRRALQQRKVSTETMNAALDKVFEETPETELIKRAIHSRTRGLPETREELKKLYDFLMRRGFSYDVIKTAVQEEINARLEEE